MIDKVKMVYNSISYNKKVFTFPTIYFFDNAHRVPKYPDLMIGFCFDETKKCHTIGDNNCPGSHAWYNEDKLNEVHSYGLKIK